MKCDASEVQTKPARRHLAKICPGSLLGTPRNNSSSAPRPAGEACAHAPRHGPVRVAVPLAPPQLARVPPRLLAVYARVQRVFGSVRIGGRPARRAHSGRLESALAGPHALVLQVVRAPRGARAVRSGRLRSLRCAGLRQ